MKTSIHDQMLTYPQSESEYLYSGHILRLYVKTNRSMQLSNQTTPVGGATYGVRVFDAQIPMGVKRTTVYLKRPRFERTEG